MQPYGRGSKYNGGGGVGALTLIGPALSVAVSGTGRQPVTKINLL